MTVLNAKAPAKINLSLHVLGRRGDGYHNIETVMASVSLYDDLTMALTPCEKGAEAFTARAEGVTGGNLAARAARLFMERRPGWSVHIDIEKRIPVSAGLGGGSSDAAAVLRALDGWAKTQQGPTDGQWPPLQALASEIGSDVPYCLHGGVCMAEGRGELLTPLPPLPDCQIVLVTPPVTVSTAEAFRLYDALTAPPRSAGNVFEEVLQIPAVAEIKQLLTDAGASNAMMSGSGPTVFGIFHDQKRAETAFDKLRAQFPKTYLAASV